MAIENSKVNVYDIVTSRFMAQLSEGIVPWKKPWISPIGARVGAWSHSKGIPYSLLNQMMLPFEGEYVTFKEANKEGGQIKKGAVGYPIVFWKSYQIKTKNPDTNVEEIQTVPVLKYYTVYHISDTTGIAQKFNKDTGLSDGLKAPQRHQKAEHLFDEYIERSGVKFRRVAGDRAYYSPMSDQITLPLKKQFTSKGEYYSTLFHETVHSTGHRTRLNRIGTMTAARGKEYSLEELVAEIGAAAILYNLGIENNDTIQNSNAYLQSWYCALSNDPKMIVKASSRAQKAVRYIFGDAAVTPSSDWKPYSDGTPETIVPPGRDNPSWDTGDEVPWDTLNEVETTITNRHYRVKTRVLVTGPVYLRQTSLISEMLDEILKEYKGVELVVLDDADFDKAVLDYAKAHDIQVRLAPSSSGMSVKALDIKINTMLDYIKEKAPVVIAFNDNADYVVNSIIKKSEHDDLDTIIVNY